ncbi:LPD29 domain-containing protein [Pseudomonas mohnii]
MTTRYLTCAETAKLVRKALKEAFPDVKFSVRSNVYSGGASLSVSWTDGPNIKQVESVTCRFQASYFDGGIDYKGSIYHMMHGETVSFGADFINTQRAASDFAVEQAIDRVYRNLRGNFTEAGMQKPTVEDFRSGKLWTAILPGYHNYGGESVQSDINAVLNRSSDRLRGRVSATAQCVFVTHDDGYSRQCGSGFSAVTIQ